MASSLGAPKCPGGRDASLRRPNRWCCSPRPLSASVKRRPMRHRTLRAAAGVIILVAAVTVLVAMAGATADDRVRAHFEIPQDTPVDAASITAAVLRLVPVGTLEPEVASRLAKAGIGNDRLSRYYPQGPTNASTGVVRIEYDPNRLQLVAVHYGDHSSLQFRPVADERGGQALVDRPVSATDRSGRFNFAVHRTGALVARSGHSGIVEK